MVLPSLAILLFSLAEFVLSTPSPRHIPRQQPTSTGSAEVSVPTVCGDLINDVNNGSVYFVASYAFECLTSVPFNDDVALRFIDYYNTTLQFQSTLAYLKDPPPGYQQPSVDLLDGLQQIKNNVTAGIYKNQYAFEVDVQHLVYSVHDSHVNLFSGILSSFSFGSSTALVAVSVDGTSVPDVYIADDVWERQQSGGEIFPVTEINGEDTIQYLTRLAALNSVGMLEPHADWNQLMISPVQLILDSVNVLTGGATFYEGDSLNFTRSNGSVQHSQWVAVYTNEAFTGPLTTGGDYYNYFVLGLTPSSINDVPLPPRWNYTISDTTQADDSDTSPISFETGWDNYTEGMYPKADVVQYDIANLGWVTGYYFDDISTGILSIPSFDESGWTVGNFSTTVTKFLDGAQNRSLSKIIIDLQGNPGGTPLLAFTTFRDMFPSIEPFAGSRRRSHRLADVVGNTKTTYWSDLLPAGGTNDVTAADEWVVIDRLNAETGRNFSSWAEYFGPRPEHGDLFSLVERYDLANTNFDENAFDGWIPFQYTSGNIPAPSTPDRWRPEDVVVLTDGTCSSTCALFLEMMTHDAGVRSIVVGGQPKPGPMQAASGARGASSYDSYSLDSDFNQTVFFNSSTADQIPNRDTGMFITYAGFNLRDQVRKADPVTTPPLQFSYEAADCRLYLTLDNVFNMSQLWRDVAAAAWDDNFPSRCVLDSAGYSNSGNSTATKPPPQSTAISQPLPALEYGYDLDPWEQNGLDDGERSSVRSATAPVKHCKSQADCISGVTSCLPVRGPCPGQRTEFETTACVTTCTKGTGSSPCTAPNTFCDGLGYGSSRSNSVFRAPTLNGKKRGQSGVCAPTKGNTNLGCPTNV